jgi:hypothetical protein
MGHGVEEPGQCFDFGLGLPAFSSLEAAAAFCVARLVEAECVPGLGLQLPLVRGFFPGTGSNPGQQGLTLSADFFADFFVVVMLISDWPGLREAACLTRYLVGCVV